MNTCSSLRIGIVIFEKLIRMESGLLCIVVYYYVHEKIYTMCWTCMYINTPIQTVQISRVKHSMYMLLTVLWIDKIWHILMLKIHRWMNTLTSFSHRLLRSGSLRMMETRSAPWTGGLLYIGLAICCNWLFTATACISFSQRMLPTSTRKTQLKKIKSSVNRLWH